jgi:hypothetical protein
MPAILTISHSTRPVEEFVELLQANGVKPWRHLHKVALFRGGMD